MLRYNIIWVASPDEKQVLMCLRAKDPYKGLYNLVGGKMEPGEDDLDSAYRELWEESGIGREDIRLSHFLSFYYPVDDCEVKAYAGRLRREVELVEEAHKLCWMPVEGTDFFSTARFAGEGNIGHMLEHVKMHRETLYG